MRLKFSIAILVAIISANSALAQQEGYPPPGPEDRQIEDESTQDQPAQKIIFEGPKKRFEADPGTGGFILIWSEDNMDDWIFSILDLPPMSDNSDSTDRWQLVNYLIEREQV